MDIKEEFEKRIVEIERYFEILAAIELDRPKLISFDVTLDEQKEIIFDSKHINILRASTFLLMYNLVESTIYNSVVVIFDSISSSQHSPSLKFFDVIDDIKKYWLSHSYKHDENAKKDSVINWYMTITDKIFSQSLGLISNQIQYGGSIDAQNIRKIAKSLGMNLSKISENYREVTHGEALKEIKQKRNWLAHGEKTFSEIGQDYPVSRLLEWKDHTKEHLEKYIESVEDYIINQHYKKVSA
jgi:hypothetical protein